MLKSCKNSTALGVLLLCFFTQSVLPPVGFAASGRVSPANDPPLSSQGRTIKVPARLGTIEESFEGATPFPVLLIQDAHAHPDAQKNIAKLIRHFQNKNGVRTIALEGAFGPLDFQFLRSFPDQLLLRRVLRKQMNHGELAGGPAAGLFYPDLSRYEGIEDWSTYEESIRLYKKALASSAPSLKKLDENEKNLKARRAAVFSPKLLEISESLDNAFDKNANFLEILQTLSQIKIPPPGSSLELILKIQQEVSPEIRRELLSCAERLQKEQQPVLDPAGLAEKLQNFRTSQMTAGEFGFFLKSLCGRSCSFSGELLRVIGEYQQLQNLKGAHFMSEFETYAGQIKAVLFKNDEERNLEREIHGAGLMKKLASLEVSRRDWQEISGPESRPRFCNAALQAACSFYENAESRDRLFLENLKRISGRNKLGSFPVILIAGGFHTEGLAKILRGRNVSYRVISPRMDSLRGGEFYRRQMDGKVSWQSYLKPAHQKINLYEAYHRAIRDRLLQPQTQGSQPYMLKGWRDQILRDLASAGSLEKAQQYTRFLDEVVKDEKRKKTEDAKKIELRIEEFVRQLKILKTSGALTPASMIRLIQTAQTQTLYAVAPFQPLARFNLAPVRSEVRSDGTPDKKKKPAKKRTEKAPVTQSLWSWTDGGGLSFEGTKIIQSEKVERVVEREFQAVLKSLDKQTLLFLAARYGVNLKNILWGMIGSSLAGQFDREQVEKAIDAQIVGLINQMGEEETDEGLAPIAASPETEKKPVVFEPPEISQNDIVKIAKNISSHLEAVEARGVIDRGLYELAYEQAAIFITKLEERFFFKNYYSANPDAFTGTRAAETIRDILKGETQPLVHTALEKVLEQILNAIGLQDQLHQKGMNKNTYLNLYQLVGVQQMLEAKKIILADEMGLGKTLETLAAFLLSDTREMMIFGPNLALKRWLEDIADHLSPEFDVVILAQDAAIPKKLSDRKEFPPVTFKKSKDRYEYFLSERAPPAEGRKRIVLMNYEAVPHLKNYAKKNGKTKPAFEFLAFDEAHLLKNKNSKTSGFLWGSKEDPSGIHASFETVITGTPLENGPADLLRPLQYLAFGDTSEAGRLFASIDSSRYARIFRKSDVGRLSLLMTYMAMHMIRRLKADVMTGLPVKKWIRAKLDPLAGTMKIGDQVVELSGDYRRQLDMYELVLSDPEAFERLHVHPIPLDEDLLENGNGEDAEKEEEEPAPYAKTVQITRLEQVALDAGVFGAEGDSIKLDAAEYLIRERLAQNKSIIVYSPYRTAGTERLRDQLIRNGLGQYIAYIDGSVPKNVRNREIDRFQNKQARIIIATAATAGIAINLTQADTVLWLNRTWKPSTDNQAIDRAHRLDAERNYPGKELEIIDLELDLPVSIDVLKANFLRHKEILAEIIVNANLTPEILKAYRDSDDTLMEAIEEAADNPVKLDEYEQTVAQKFRLLIGRILKSRDAEELARLWEEAANLYIALLDHKGSFYANMASLDHLASEAYPELKGSAPKQVLDLASGPSTLYQAYKRRVAEFIKAGFLLDITDYDASEQMLKLGIRRQARQILGSFSGLSAMPSDQYHVVNLSYAFRYAEHPADVIRQIHRMLKDKGIFVLILPSTNVIPRKFYEALKRAGFTLRVGENAQLESKLDPETYKDFVREFGKEFADDMARHVKGVTTYLVASKDGDLPAESKLTDDDFRLARELPVVDKNKILKLQDSEGRYKFIPENAFIVGEVKIEDDAVVAGRKQNENQKKIYRRSERSLFKLAEAVRRFQESPSAKDPKSERRQNKLAADIEVYLDNLQADVETYVLQYDSSDRESLRRQLETFKEQKFVRTWLSKSGRQGDIDEMIQTLQRSEVRTSSAQPEGVPAEEGKKRLLAYVQAVANGETDLSQVSANLRSFKQKTTTGAYLNFGRIDGKEVVISHLRGYGDQEIEIGFEAVDEENKSKGVYLRLTAADGTVWYRDVKSKEQYFKKRLAPGFKELSEYVQAVIAGTKDLTRVSANLRGFKQRTNNSAALYFGNINGKHVSTHLHGYGNREITIEFEAMDEKDKSKGVYLKLTAADGSIWYRGFKNDGHYLEERAAPGVQALLEYVQAMVDRVPDLSHVSGNLKSFNQETDGYGNLYFGTIAGKAAVIRLRSYGNQEIAIEFEAADEKDKSKDIYLKLTAKDGSVWYRAIKSDWYYFEERAAPGVQELLEYVQAVVDGVQDLTQVSANLRSSKQKTGKRGNLRFGNVAGKDAKISLHRYGNQEIVIEYEAVNEKDKSKGVHLKVKADDGQIWVYDVQRKPSYFKQNKKLTEKARIEKSLNEIYARLKNFQETFDVTSLFSEADLAQGFAPVTFPLPGGQIWGSERSRDLKLGRSLKKVEIHISRKANQLSFAFTGTQRSEVRKEPPQKKSVSQEEGTKRLRAYVEAVIRGEKDLSQASRDLKNFKKETGRNGGLFFGKAGQGWAVIALEGYGGQEIEIAFEPLDKKDRSKGVYLKLTAADGTVWYKSVKRDGSFFEERAAPGIQELLEYIETVAEAETDLARVSKNLKSFKKKANKAGLLYLGMVKGKPAGIKLEGLAEQEIKVSFEPKDKNDKSKGVYLKLTAQDGTIWYKNVKADGGYFQDRAAPGVQELLQYVEAVRKGESDLREVSKNLKSFKRKTSASRALHFGKVNGRGAVIQLHGYGDQEIKVAFEPLDKKDKSKGVHLKLTADDGQMWVYEVKKEPGYFAQNKNFAQKFRVAKQLKEIYLRQEDFEETLDITPLFSDEDLDRGRAPAGFPLPDGHAWENNRIRDLKVGKDLRQVGMRIWRKAGQLDFDFIGAVRGARTRSTLPQQEFFSDEEGSPLLLEYIEAVIQGQADLGPVSRRLKPFRKKTFVNRRLHLGKIKGANAAVNVSQKNQHYGFEFLPVDEEAAAKGVYLKLTAEDGTVSYRNIKKEPPYFEERDAPGVLELLAYIDAVRQGHDLAPGSKALKPFNKKVGSRGLLNFGAVDGEQAFFNLAGYQNQEVAVRFELIDKQNASKGAYLIVTAGDGKVWYRNIKKEPNYFTERAAPGSQEILDYIAALIEGRTDLGSVISPPKPFGKSVDRHGRLYFGKVGDDPAVIIAREWTNQEVRIEFEEKSQGVYLKVTGGNGDVWVYDIKSQPFYFKRNKKVTQKVRVEKHLREIYSRSADFEETLDVTAFFSEEELVQGLAPADFPLPDGQVWGADRSRDLKLGRPLKKVEIRISRKSSRLTFAFTGLRRSEVRMEPAQPKWASVEEGAKRLQAYVQAVANGETDLNQVSANLRSFKKKTDKNGFLYFGIIAGNNARINLSGYGNQEIAIEYEAVDAKDQSKGVYLKLTAEDGTVFYRDVKSSGHYFEMRAVPRVQELLNYVQAVVDGAKDLTRVSANLKSFKQKAHKSGLLHFGTIAGKSAVIMLAGYGNQEIVIEYEAVDKKDKSKGIYLKLTAEDGTVFYRDVKSDGSYFEVRATPGVKELLAYVQAVVDRVKDLSHVSMDLKSFKQKIGKNGFLYFGIIAGNPAMIMLRGFSDQEVVIEYEAADEKNKSKGVYLKLKADNGQIWIYDVQQTPSYFKQNKKLTEKARLEKSLNEIYARLEDFEETLDVTSLFSDDELAQGLAPVDFPLPDGQVWGADRSRDLKLGSPLKKVEIRISRKSGRLTFAFTGVRRSEVRNKKSQDENLGGRIFLDYVEAVVKKEKDLSQAAKRLQSFKKITAKDGSVHLGSVRQSSVRIRLGAKYGNQEIEMGFEAKDPSDVTKGVRLKVTAADGTIWFFDVWKTPVYLRQDKPLTRKIQLRNQLRAIYSRRENFEEETVDITPLFTDVELSQGIVPVDFPLPDNQVWGNERSRDLKIGKNLKTVGIRIRREGEKLSFDFTNAVEPKKIKRFKPEQPDLRLQEEVLPGFSDEADGKKSILAYIQALMRDDDLSDVTRPLKPFRAKSYSNGKLHFGAIDTKAVQLNFGTKAVLDLEIRPLWNDPNDASKGVYLEIKTQNEILYYQIKKGQGHFQKRFAPGAKELIDYIDAFRREEDLSQAVKTMKPFSWQTGETGTAHIGHIEGVTIKFPLLSEAINSSVQIVPTLVDSEDPSQGVYLEIKGERRSWYYEFKKEPAYVRQRLAPGPKELLDCIQVLKEDGDLSTAVKRLKPFTVETYENGYIPFGSPSGSDRIGIQVHRMKQSSVVEVTPFPLDSADLSKGAYLAIKMPEGTFYYKIKKEPGYFEQRPAPGFHEIMNYIETLKAGTDLTEAALALRPFEAETGEGGKLYLGALDGGVGVHFRNKGNSRVQVQPILIDPNQPALGAYLKFIIGDQEWFYAFKRESAYLVQRYAPGIHEIVNYVKALKNGDDLAGVSTALKPLEIRTGKNGSLYFASLEEGSLNILITDSPNTVFQIIPHLIDPANPSQGAYLEAKSKKRALYYAFKKTPNHFVQRPGPGTKEIMDYLAALNEGKDLTLAAQALRPFTLTAKAKGVLYFGTIQRKVAMIRLYQFADRLFEIIPHLKHPNHPSQGAYLEVKTDKQTWYYDFKIGGGFFEQNTQLARKFKIGNVLRNSYARQEEFEESFDVTPFFTAEELTQGIAPIDFPLPGGQVWGTEHDRNLKIGKNLEKVEIHVSRKGGKLNFAFTGTRRSEVRKPEAGVRALLDYIQAVVRGEQDLSLVSAKLKSFTKKTGGTGFLYFAPEAVVEFGDYPNQDIIVEFKLQDEQDAKKGVYMKLITPDKKVWYRSIQGEPYYLKYRDEPGGMELQDYIQAVIREEKDLSQVSANLKSFRRTTGRTGVLRFRRVDGSIPTIALSEGYKNAEILIEFELNDPEDAAKGAYMKLTAPDGKVWYRSIKKEPHYFEDRAEPGVQELLDYIKAVANGEQDLSRISAKLKSFRRRVNKGEELYFGKIGENRARIVLKGRKNEEMIIEFKPRADALKSIYLKLTAPDGEIWIMNVKAQSDYFELDKSKTKRERTRRKLEQLYQRIEEFQETVDITDFFSEEELLQGIAPVDFPLPGGQVWGTERDRNLKIGKNLEKVKIHISRKAGQLNFAFTGTSRSEVRAAAMDSILITLALLQYSVAESRLFEAADHVARQIQAGPDSAPDDFGRDIQRLAAFHGNPELMRQGIQAVATESRTQLAAFTKQYGQSTELLRIGLDYPSWNQTQQPVSDAVMRFYAGFLASAGWSGQPGHYQVALIEKSRLPASQMAFFQKADISLTSTRLGHLKNPAAFKVPLLHFQPDFSRSGYSWLANLGLNLQEGRSSRQAQELTIAFQLATAVGYAGAQDVLEARTRFERLFDLVPLLRQYADQARLLENFGKDSPVDFVFDALQTETALQALALEWAARSEVRAAA